MKVKMSIEIPYVHLLQKLLYREMKREILDLDINRNTIDMIFLNGVV